MHPITKRKLKRFLPQCASVQTVSSSKSVKNAAPCPLLPSPRALPPNLHTRVPTIIPIATVFVFNQFSEPLKIWGYVILKSGKNRKSVQPPPCKDANTYECAKINMRLLMKGGSHHAKNWASSFTTGNTRLGASPKIKWSEGKCACHWQACATLGSCFFCTRHAALA